MKKKIYLMIVIVVSMLITQSCAIIPVLSVGKSSITSKEEDSWKDPIGAQVGIIYPVANFGELLSFRAEANLSMQGAKWEETNFGESLKGRVNLFYATAPLVLRFQTKSGFFGEAGVQPGLLLSAKDKYSGNTYDFKDQLKKFDLGIPVGVGYEFKNNFGISIRVIPGLSNIYKEEDTDTEGTSKAHNFLAVLRGTYTFGKK